MIRVNLAVVMAKKRIFSIGELAERTRISRTTLTALYYDKGKGVQFQTLDTLCNELGIPLSELIEHVNEAS